MKRSMNHDVMQRLANARPAHLDPDLPVAPQTRTAELQRAMLKTTGTTAVPATRRRLPVRPAWGMLAAATAVAVVVVATASEPGSHQQAYNWHLGTPRAQADKLSARHVLLAAAQTALKEQPAEGRYWRVDYDLWQQFAARNGDDKYAVAGGYHATDWSDTKTGTLHGPAETVPYAPATEADEAAWKQAGSPNPVPVQEGVPYLPVGFEEGDKLRILGDPADAAQVERVSRPGSAPGKPYVIGRAVDLPELQALPADPDKLKADLLTGYTGRAKRLSASREEFLFDAAQGLILDLPVRPAVRAAAFRMLADLDGITVLDHVTDVSGRTGTAVTINKEGRGGGTAQHRIIFDRATSRGLTADTVVVEPTGDYVGFKPGAIVYSQVVKKTEWTDEKPAETTGS
ncbi:CU044_5270 family protein [Streptomyces sp. ME19-01-6]|uniref:CU044_5270 family protein n=1 Tax=Streptomyces sp. ME19-01-6 TaxID=3028686 RepID=UPI0029A293B4|nr:CU044_5270 family protein [Streptomyces sp. ME19-01-6]MDX3229724.1 CU044_5270 family protein [Streptomyces sp. ME19-01-6]